MSVRIVNACNGCVHEAEQQVWGGSGGGRRVRVHDARCRRIQQPSTAWFVRCSSRQWGGEVRVHDA